VQCSGFGSTLGLPVRCPHCDRGCRNQDAAVRGRAASREGALEWVGTGIAGDFTPDPRAREPGAARGLQIDRAPCESKTESGGYAHEKKREGGRRPQAHQQEP
jgi:hypothetical protein